jgi:hypothetical protein
MKQVVGHLVDSASNNHQRFVRAQWTSDLVCAGYQQEAWVSSQRYGDAEWGDLVTLWQAFNRHLAWVMASIPGDVRERSRHPHNLHELTSGPFEPESPVTLDDFMCDYVEHLKHHVRQLDELRIRFSRDA